MAKKSQKTQQNQLDKLKQELDTTQTENKSLVAKLDELESHREYLMDKVNKILTDLYIYCVVYKYRWKDFMLISTR